jgi:hypothetical protein
MLSSKSENLVKGIHIGPVHASVNIEKYNFTSQNYFVL